MDTTRPNKDDGLALSQAEGIGAASEEFSTPFVRIAELEIVPEQLENYKVAVREEIETSVRTEPGVIAIYATAEKDNLGKIKFFEIYVDEAAYSAHIASPHFKKYAEQTKNMISAKRLIETVPVQLSAKRM
jgi:quinol monooxygenase YgiN